MCKTNSHYKFGLMTSFYNGKYEINVKIDQRIRNIIILLNQLGFHTQSSCECVGNCAGPMDGLSWVQFVNVGHFQKLLSVAKQKHERLLKWLNGLSNSKVWVMGKPTLDGDMKLDFYFQPHDIPFFEKSLQELRDLLYSSRKFQSKL